MSELTDIKRQIAALEAKAARLLEAEMKTSIAKVKALMDSLGVTMEHLAGKSSKVGKRLVGGKPSAKKPAAKRGGAGVAKYRDPKSGQTWSGFGRAPAWIASVKNRESFLIDHAAAPTPTAPTKKAAKKASAGAKRAKSSAAARNATAKKASAKTAGAKKAPTRGTKSKSASRRAASKTAAPSAKKLAAKKAAPRKRAQSTAAPAGPAAPNSEPSAAV